MKTVLVAIMVIIFTSCEKENQEDLVICKPLEQVVDTNVYINIEYRVMTKAHWYKRQLTYFGGINPEGGAYWQNYSDTIGGNSHYTFRSIASATQAYTININTLQFNDSVICQLFIDGILKQEDRELGRAQIWYYNN